VSAPTNLADIDAKRHRLELQRKAIAEQVEHAIAADKRDLLAAGAELESLTARMSKGLFSQVRYAGAHRAALRRYQDAVHQHKQTLALMANLEALDAQLDLLRAMRNQGAAAFAPSRTKARQSKKPTTGGST